jgi:hypothetical protein
MTLRTGDVALTTIAQRAVVDASGSGSNARLVDPRLVHRRADGAAGGLVLVLRGAEPAALEFPRGIALLRALRAAADAGELPSGCRHTWLDQGVRDGEVYVKLMITSPGSGGDAPSEREILERARADKAALLEFLRRQDGLSRTELVADGGIGVRDAGSVVGEYTLTRDDVRGLRRFDDCAARCAWPIEHWHPDTGVSLEYLPAGGCYEIPLRALKVRGVANLWTAGKCLSADAGAQASARVVGACWAMGEAAGNAAAAAST